MSVRCLLSRVGFAVGVSMAFWCVPALAVAAPLEVLSESFSDVGSTSATVSAKIVPGGQPTSFRVEYGPMVAYGSSTSSANVGGGTEAVGVTAQLDGLQAGVPYHFRVVATNGSGVVDGEDVTFSTLPTGLLGLPDNRGYEMVTPPDNEGVQVYQPGGAHLEETENSESSVPTEFPTRAAADGDAVAYVGDPDVAGNGSQGSGLGNEYMATREQGDGWKQSTLQPKGLLSPMYAWFSDDLSTSVLESREPLVPGVPSGYAYLYSRDDSNGSLHPLFTVAPPDREAASFGAASPLDSLNYDSLGWYYAGASSDNKHFFFEANDALTNNAIDGGELQNNLYESTNGVLQLVNALPDGSTQPNASVGAPPVQLEEGENVSHAISADGSRVFWTDINTGALYVREDGTSTTLVSEHATFLTASTDGSRVLYTKSGDLYEEDLSDRVTRDLAPGAQVLGLAGASEDVEYIYFVAEGNLAAGATPGQPNLYLYHGGSMTLVATLASGEKSYTHLLGGPYDDWSRAPGHRTAEATPDGHALVFESTRSLTGYDNRNQEGSSVKQVYVYDAASGALSCASCSPSGERPGGTGESEAYAGHLTTTERQTYQVRSISSDGDEVFFQTGQPLVAQDVNGTTDVYEWERDGSGSCALSAGCIYLLSNGSSQGESFFLDASETGSDVFIVTEAQLAPQDRNEIFDLYDARVDAEQPVSRPQCTGAGCQGVPESPPIFATPSSATFNGVGNFTAPVKAATKVKSKLKKKAKRKAGNKHKRRKNHGKAAEKAEINQGTVGKSGRGRR
jgi:Fibronectin type III domain